MKKSTIILLAGLALAGAKDLFAQNSVSGYITNLFNNQPIPQALVTVEGFGSDSTDANGFYEIQNTGISPYVFIPNKALPDKLQIVNALGQSILNKKISLNDVIDGNILKVDNLQNIASGIYPFRLLDKNNNFYASGMMPIIEGSNVSLVPFNVIEPKRSNGGRTINSPTDDDYVSFTVDAEGYLFREAWIEDPNGNIIHDEGIIPNLTPEDSLFIEFFNEVCMRNENYGSSRWVTNPTFYIDTTEVNLGDPATPEAIDNYVENIVDLNQFTLGNVTGDYVLCDSGPTPQTPEVVNNYWDYSTPNPGGVGYGENDNEIYYAYVRIRDFNVGYGTYKEEITQTTGPKHNSSLILPTIFNGSATEYQEHDLKVGQWLYTRPPGNKVPDKDPNPN